MNENAKFNIDRKLVWAFRAIFPEHAGEIKIVESRTAIGDPFHYVNSKENRLKVMADRVEVWEKINTKNPIKTLEIEKQTMEALYNLYL